VPSMQSTAMGVETFWSYAVKAFHTKTQHTVA